MYKRYILIRGIFLCHSTSYHPQSLPLPPPPPLLLLLLFVEEFKVRDGLLAGSGNKV